MASAGTQIARARRTAGLSQSALARRTGTSQPAVSRYERGRATPSTATLGRLLRACRGGRRPGEALLEHRDEVVERLQRWGATTVLVFGSVARDEDDERSDVDLLVDRLNPDAYSWGQPIVEEELETLLGFPVDVGEIRFLKPSVAEDAYHDARPL